MPRRGKRSATPDPDALGTAGASGLACAIRCGAALAPAWACPGVGTTCGGDVASFRHPPNIPP